MWSSKRTANGPCPLPPPSTSRLQASLEEKPFDLEVFISLQKDEEQTVFYLGYGSNLSNEAFRGKRGIRPLSQINVQVPSLRVVFDLPGIPYLEPCFANSALRDPEEDHGDQTDSRIVDNEKTTLLGGSSVKTGYRKDQWRKGLIGVVYEVTAKDFAHIIETEGGGASYQDITVDCYPFATSDPTEPVPWHPTQQPFKAHTLFAPVLPPDDPRGRIRRPDPSYAQASARYLKLICDGAAELGLPYEYQEHLHSLRSFHITTVKQRMGQVALLAMWAPVLALVFGLSKVLADKRGRVPAWLVRVLSGVFKAVWTSYDNVFKPVFGDGERTLTDRVDDGERAAVRPTEMSTAAAAVELERVVTNLG